MIVFKKLVTVLVVLSVCVVFSVDAFPAQKEPVKAKGSSKLININTANADSLMKLPRVGPKISQRIIDFRTKHGKFKKPADIMKVKGIGEKTFEKLKNLITV